MEFTIRLASDFKGETIRKEINTLEDLKELRMLGEYPPNELIIDFFDMYITIYDANVE